MKKSILILLSFICVSINGQFLQVAGGGVPEEAGYPAVIEDGNTVGWYIADELSTITKDGGNLVSDWEDRLGSGRDLEQGTGTNQPLWSSDGILFDGIDDVMKVTGGFVYTQPEMIYIVFKQLTWTRTDRVFDGNSQTTGQLIQFNTPTPNLTASAGTNSAQNDNLAINTFGIIRILFNGASSTFQINNTTQITGDFGAYDMNGFTLGAWANIANFSHIQVKEIILRKIADATGDEQDIYNYLASKYSI